MLFSQFVALLVLASQNKSQIMSEIFIRTWNFTVGNESVKLIGQHWIRIAFTHQNINKLHYNNILNMLNLFKEKREINKKYKQHCE